MEYPRLILSNKRDVAETINIEKEKIVPMNGKGYIVTAEGSGYEIRNSGSLKELSLFLDDTIYDYIIGRDELDKLVLVRLKK